jgi:Zn-dependent protease
MWRSWKLGTAFGIGLYVHWSFLVLPAYVVFMAWGRPAAEILFLLGLLVAVFGCILLHELGHALMARQFGIGTRDITLYPIGGVARLERMSERPWEEVCIALAGPAVNAVLAVLLLALGVGVEALTGALGPGLFDRPLLVFVVTLLAANVLLAVFNLLPAFPMDGGRVLRALLSLGLGQLRATEIAAGVGVVMALALAAAPFLVGMAVPGFRLSPMLVVVGFFVLFAGQQELEAVRQRELRRQRRPLFPSLPANHEILEAEPVPAEPVAPEPTFSGFTWDARTKRLILWSNGRRMASFRSGPE